MKKESIKDFAIGTVFNKYARDYAQEVPWLDNLALVTPYELIHVSANYQTFLDENPKAQKEILRDAQKFFKKSKTVAAYLNVNDTKREGHNFIAFQFNHLYENGTYPLNREHMYYMTYTLDHEYGHQLADVPIHNNEYIYKNRLNENLADAFASFMHVRRFGPDTGYLDERAYYRSSYIVGNQGHMDATYYTSQNVLAAKAMSEEFDVKNTSIENIAWHAQAMTFSHAVTYSDASNIMAVYKSAKDLEDVAFIMLDCKDKGDEEVYRAGKLYLSAKRQKVAINAALKEEGLYGDFWRSAVKDMSKYEEDTGFALNPYDKPENKHQIKLIAEYGRDPDRHQFPKSKDELLYAQRYK